MNFVQAPASDVVHKPPDDDVTRDERGGQKESDVLLHTFLYVRKRQEIDRAGIGTNVLLDLGVKIRIVEGEHAAVGMMDDGNLIGAEQALRDDERAEGVPGSTSRVPNHMRISLLNSESMRRDDASVHASQDCQLPARRHRQVTPVKCPDIFCVRFEQLIAGRHVPSLAKWLDRCRRNWWTLEPTPRGPSEVSAPMWDLPHREPGRRS